MRMTIGKSICKGAGLVAMALVLSACGITTGKKEVAMTAPEPEQRTYRLTEADIAVPLPGHFLRRSPDLLEEHFGSPSLVRREGDAEVRQYAAEAPFGRCVILAILFEERGFGWRTDRLVVRENGTEAAEPIHCLREIAFSAQRLS